MTLHNHYCHEKLNTRLQLNFLLRDMKSSGTERCWFVWIALFCNLAKAQTHRHAASVALLFLSRQFAIVGLSEQSYLLDCAPDHSEF